MLTAALPQVPPGSVILRLAADDVTWIDRLPVAPQAVTVTVDRPELARVPVDELVAKGYRIAGVVPGALDADGAVDLLVPGALRTAHPTWWAAVCRSASRVLDLEMGPVRALLADALRAHAGDPSGARR